MGVYAKACKVSESDECTLYQYRDSGGSYRIIILDKVNETIVPADGIDDFLFSAVVRKLAATWLRSGEAPEELLVQA